MINKAVSLEQSEPISRPNLVNEVVDRLQREILDGRYPPGAVLPSQEHLGGLFGVSRTVLREAMRVLASRGLVQISQGRRAQVTEASGDSVVESFETFVRRNEPSPLALLEVRRPLEISAAALAAQRATPEDLAALEATVDRSARGKTHDDIALADIDFHQALARATGNPIFPMLQRSLATTMDGYLHWAMRGLGLRPSEHGHGPILRAVAQGDADAARQAMDRHLRAAERDIRSLVEQATDPNLKGPSADHEDDARHQ